MGDHRASSASGNIPIPPSIQKLMGPQNLDTSLASAPTEEDHYSIGSGSNTLEEIMDVEDDDPGDPDPRILFLYMYINRSFKIKADRWGKVVQADDTRKIIFNFLDKPEVDKLIFSFPSPGFMLPFNDFPPNAKGKCAYFIKKTPCKLTKENITEEVNFGDFSVQPIEELTATFEEGDTKLLVDGPYKSDWDDAMAADIRARIRNMKDTVTKLKNEMRGEPRFIMPPELDTVDAELANVKKSEGKSADPKLRRIYEKAVLGWWLHLNEDILLSKSPADSGMQSNFAAEFTYWENRTRILEEIYRQISDPRVRSMVEILTLTESQFLTCFRECLASIVEALNRARDMESNLSCLKKQVDALQSTPFEEGAAHFRPLVYNLGLIWARCPGFNETNDHFRRIANLLNNMVIVESGRAIDPGAIFQGDVDDNLPKVKKCVENIALYKEEFMNFDQTVLKCFEKEEDAKVWQYHPEEMFERYDRHFKRMEQVEFCLNKWFAYNKLEKIAVGGFYSENLTMRLEKLAADFEELLNVFRNVTYDPGDIDELAWDVDFANFCKHVDDMDNRFAAIASLAFDDCPSFEEIFKMIYLFQPFFQDYYVMRALEPKYGKIADLFRSEVISSYKIYNEQMEKYKLSGVFEVPSMWPQTAGALLWLRNAKNRLLYPLDNINTYNLEATNTQDMLLLRQKAKDLMATITSLESEIFDKFCNQVASEIRLSLKKTVLTLSNAKVMHINFDKKLDAALRETRYLKYIDIENVPLDAIELYNRSDELYEWNTTLHKTVGWYNMLRQKTRPQEFDIIENEILDIDIVADVLISTNDWYNRGNWEVIERLREAVWKVAERVIKAQDNLQTMIDLINQWNFKPLFMRPQNKPNGLLVHSDINSINKRYDAIIDAGERIYELLEANFRLLHALPPMPKTKGLPQEGEGGDEGAPGTVVQLLLNPEDDDEERPVMTKRKTIAEQTEELKAELESIKKKAKKEEAEQPVAATSSAEDATEGKSLPKPKSKSGSPKSGKSAAEEQQAPESDLGEKPEKKKSKKTVAFAEKDAEVETEQMGEMEDEIEGEALYSESPDTTADDSSPDAFDAMAEDENEMEFGEEIAGEGDEYDVYIYEVEEEQVLQLERPYERAYYLSDLWKSEREGGPRPKLEDYEYLAKKSASNASPRGGSTKQKKSNKKRTKTGSKTSAGKREGKKEKSPKPSKTQKPKRAAKSPERGAPAKNKSDKKSPPDKKKAADKKAEKEKPDKKKDDKKKEEKQTVKETKKADLGKVEDLDDFEAETATFVIDDLPLEEEEEVEAVMEATPEELYLALMEQFVTHPEKLIRWDNYLDMVDDIVQEGLLHVVGASIGFFIDEMEYDPRIAPLFETKMKLVEPDIVFEPSLDDDPENKKSLLGLINFLIKDINAQALLVPRISIYAKERTYMDDILENNQVRAMENETIKRFQLAIAKAKNWVQMYYVHEYLWKDNKTEHLRQFLKYNRLMTEAELEIEKKAVADPTNFKLPEPSPPALTDFKTKIDFYMKVYRELQAMETTYNIDNWLKIDLNYFKIALLSHVERWGLLYKNYLIDDVNNKIYSLEQFIIDMTASLQRPLVKGDYDGLVAVIGALCKVKDRATEADGIFEPLAATIELLKEYHIEFPEELHDLLSTLPDKWNNLKKLATAVKTNAGPLLREESATIKKRLLFFDVRQNIFMSAFLMKSFFNWDCWEPYIEIDNCEYEITKMEELCAKLEEQAALFEVAVPEFRLLKRFRHELKNVKIMWDYITVVRSMINEWENTPWKKVDSELIDMELKKFAKELKALDKEMREWDLFKRLDAVIKNMITALRAITELQNPAMRERHWRQLMNATQVKFTIHDHTTLKELLDLNLYKFEEEVKNIVDKSVKENAFEKTLTELKHIWTAQEFSYEPHARSGYKVLKINEETVETLEENQVALQNMLNSKFVAFFLEEVTEWQKKLSTADLVIHAWTDVQRTWMYLESIFIGSEDIRRQLPNESKLFDKVDREFKQMLQEINHIPNVVKATNRPHLQDRLEALQGDLTTCEKALSDYLETKRLAYPRFYFVSSADLLDILSNGNQPELVCRHLTKLYDSVAKLKFKQEGGKNTKMAIGFWAKDGEYVATTGLCDCGGQVEKWLNNVTTIMRRTLRNILNHAVKAYDDKPRESWIFDYPAQLALVGTQIWWAVEVEISFSKIEEGYENAMKEYQKKQIQQLNSLINLMLGDLTDGDRTKITTICTIDVHSRDVVAKLISMKIEDSHAFQWQSQLRHRWDYKQHHCFVNICDAQFRYDYEYLGNGPRLVITPLTDRCYITLTQSLHLIMGGAPAGPAGTGKTETTKDLGKGIGMMVYVFNCSEQMDYKSCGTIYKGLAQTGAWGCFDEFNRISVEVLSVIAVQVKSVLDAIKSKKSTFNFQGEIISLIPTVGMFITMNPGYAGRAELPENLKALFRPCAMVVPDFELICEIMLIGEAFQEARVLGKKFLTLYSLCKELLSKQDHYDWGLRAIKSVLVVAGKLRRGDIDRPEDQVLMRALRDFNIPKIVTDDVPVFMGLIGDLFPGLNVPRKRDLDFEALVRQATIDRGLQPEDNFILKVVQLVELFAVRHSVFIIGLAGTGKSEVWKTLFRTYVNMKKRPHFNDLEPKAVTNDELFGIINPQTREWKDGLFSVLIRDQANMSGDGPKWMVMDGDIDPMWIESLNTVMDDNKVLTLASNERIALTPSMRLLFEISNLRTATPATVSRAGILYINPTDLGWNPYVQSWLDTRSNENEKVQLMIFFEKYVGPILEAGRSKWKRITPIPEIAHVHMLCSLLEVLIVPTNLPADSPKEWYEIYFVFAAIWAFGSACFKAQIVDWRMEFTKWWINEFKTVKFPYQVQQGTQTLFNYFVNQDDKRFLPWSEKLTDFELDYDVPLQATLVNTAETTRVRYFLDLLIDKRKPVMLIAPTGSGKTVLINDKLGSLSDKYGVTNIPFNFYTTSEALQKVLEKPLEKKAGRNYAPQGTKTMIYFIDDMNMPMVDKYGTVQPHTLVRQFMDYQHWYDRIKLALKDIHNIMFLASMNPTAGSFTIDPRLQRHFSVFALSFPNAEALTQIYSSILKQHMYGAAAKFAAPIAKLYTLVVNLALALHDKVASTFLPTAIKFHYVFSLRDLSNIFQSIILSNQECINSPQAFLRLWTHEAERIYCDRLVSQKEQDSYKFILAEILKRYATEFKEEDIMIKPLIFCHFAEGVGDSKYMPIRDWEHLFKLLSESMANYNELVGSMNLVLFEDAMSHVCRINRVMEMPRGNAMLVGVGGSGKQSLSRLSAFISSRDPFQIQLRKGYSLADLKADLASLYIKAGLKNSGIMFLMTDSQVAEEKFLTAINDMLSSGDIPELFADDEVDHIINTIGPETKSAGLLDTRENCWKFFIDRVRLNIKTMLCFSPVGSTLRVRARKFPALVNCTTIDWFMEWPKSALESVSLRFLGEISQVPLPLRKPISLCMAQIHSDVNLMSQIFMTNERRYYYTTPKSFLELISLYVKILISKFKENHEKIHKLQTGLQKLVSCSEQATQLKSRLGEQQKIVAEKSRVATELVKLVGKESDKVSKENMFAKEEERKCQIMEVEVSIKQKICEEDLLKALPALEAAQAALNTLNKDNLTELKTFVTPPPAVARVAEAVLVLLSKKGKVPKDRSWKACKAVMGSADAFLQTLVNYNKENILPPVVAAIQEYINDPEFTSENVVGKSKAAAGLCAWVVNIMKFHEVWMIILPKKKAEAAARNELARTKAKLAELMERIQKLNDQLEELKKKFNKAVEDKMECERDEEKMIQSIDLANRLINGLSSENARWKETVITLNAQLITFPGDLLVVASFVSYQGGFSRKYRHDLLNKFWIPKLESFQNPKIPLTENFDPMKMLADDSQIATWQNEGLPNDRMSSENAAIVTHCARWPLLIDPQLQGIKWVKQKYGTSLIVLRLGTKTYLDRIEQAISDGSVVLFENIGESVDPVLDNLLGRNLIKKGKAVKIGDREIDYNKKFRLILHTKLGNPHYQPEIQAQATLINFMVTRDGLEEQLLAEVVKAERPDLEILKANLTKQMNGYKITLKTLEDELLMRLTLAGPDIISDRVLVEKLESTKKTADHIETKMNEAKITTLKINSARENYRSVAARSSLIYFIMNDLQKVNPLYQFSLKAFTIVFHNAMKKAEHAESVDARVEVLTESITFSTFMYTSRALFEADKMIFMSIMAIQIQQKKGDVTSKEIDFLLRYPYVPNLTPLVDFLTPVQWGGIKALVDMDEFRGLDKDIEGSAKRWKKFVEGDSPERDRFPQDWKNKTAFQKCLMMRALRPDRMVYAMRYFIEQKLGVKYVQARSVEYEKSHEETSAYVPVFFILSAGVDPTRDVERVGKKVGFSVDKKNFHNVSLGQGQEIVAERAIETGAKLGHWIILQNIHLVTRWLPSLDKKMEAAQQKPHPDYRLFISSEPAPSPEYHAIPQGVLESSIKITNEPPTGMQANIHKALDNFTQDTLESCSKEAEFKAILFSLCYFHAVVAERRKFGPQGWNRKYPFNVGDLTISVSVLFNYLENNNTVPWEDLRYLFGEIMYGGHITDDWDRKLCRTYLREYMCPELLEGDLYYCPGFKAPPNTDYIGYHRYIDATIPPESPLLYGLHPNAEYNFLTTQAANLFNIIFELQPRETSGEGGDGASKEDKVRSAVDDILDKCGETFHVHEMMAKTEDRSPYTIVAFQECERMNILTNEMKRSLRELSLGLKGELTITSDMEVLEEALFVDKVPDAWMAKAYPSNLGLAAWFSDLQLRQKELEVWTGDFILPATIWLGGLFNPQSFLTAIMQMTARKNEWPLDKMCLQFDVTKRIREEFSSAPREGAYLSMLYMEGARWDVTLGTIEDSKPKELYPLLPVIHARAITLDKQDLRNIYECPAYKTKLRGPTYVWTFNLKTKQKPAKWVLAGVGVLLGI
ncbi:Dynein, axonemal heavy chain [Nesidiocoris tenuis]|uniref:Dynein, axonemal heavy chain n=1 Tax=Nesidiocoris tenuis TaxID=355587 RepID=A0ABN7BE85_9HEMI|nr:Dynein, axonemal heavy chain [Nesidiocoris tenuis]